MKQARFINELGLSAYNAGVLVAEKESADYFEALLDALVEKSGNTRDGVAKIAANWIISDLFGHLKKAGTKIVDSPVGPQQGHPVVLRR